MLDAILKRFDAPDETRTFEKGRFEIVRLGGLTIGRATYEPGWIWSRHVGPKLGLARCPLEHVGMVVAGTATAEFEDGRVLTFRAGDLFHIPADPHDSRVVGDAPYVSLHFLGGESYAAAAAAAPATAPERFEPYRPRLTRFAGVRAASGFRLKEYLIAYEDRAIDVRRFEPGIALALRALPAPAVAQARPGVGFLVAHQGRGADYVVLAFWDRENELPLRVFVSERSGAWRPAQGGESVCVWDLEVIHAERDAYVETVLATGPGAADAYLARRAPGSLT